MGTHHTNAKRERRVQRVATLDGGCSVTDNGYSQSDRDIVVECPDAADEIRDYMAYIVGNYSLVRVVLGQTCFLAVPSKYEVGTNGAATLRLLITEES